MPSEHSTRSAGSAAPHPPHRKAACIDVGSNTIKMLVGTLDPAGDRVLSLRERTLDVRLGDALGKSAPMLSPQAMQEGVTAVGSLLQEARAERADPVVVVATSAVRDALNQADFRTLMREGTGLDLQVLSGEAEASLAAAGVAQDPAIPTGGSFVLADLGGGSLELVRPGADPAPKRVSLPLGALRLTRRFVPDPAGSIPVGVREEVGSWVWRLVRESGFRFPADRVVLIGTGGGVTYARLLLGRERGLPLEECPAYIPLDDLRRVGEQLSRAPLSERVRRWELPPGRAEILPVSWFVLEALGRLAAVDGLTHSFCNLRFGVVATLLGARCGSLRSEAEGETILAALGRPGQHPGGGVAGDGLIPTEPT